MYNLLAILVHGLQQAAAVKDADLLSEEARACMQRLSSKLAKIDGEAHFRAAVRRARAPDATPAALDRARLVAQPTALRLRGSAGTDRLSLELALHVRLETGTASTVAYESRLVYAEPFPRDNPLEGSTRLYERRTAQVPVAYPLALWCGADGDKLLESEIAQGLAAIAAQLVGDLE